jgi:hypothetical protein
VFFLTAIEAAKTHMMTAANSTPAVLLNVILTGNKVACSADQARACAIRRPGQNPINERINLSEMMIPSKNTPVNPIAFKVTN